MIAADDMVPLAGWTMLDVERVIHRHREVLVQHPFLKRLEGDGTIEQFRRLLPRHAFFTLAFQDIVRLARERCTDPMVKSICRGLELGDKGHDHWYLDDLQRLGLPIDVRWLFSADHAIARDVAYEILADVLRARADCSRLSVTLSIEAIAGEFFARVTGFAQRLGVAQPLKYFGLDHLAAEQGHELFGVESQSDLGSVAVPDHAVTEARKAVETTFQAMTRLADDLEGAMRAA